MFDPVYDLFCPICDEPITLDMLCNDDIICDCGHCIPAYSITREEGEPEFDELEV